MPGHRTTRPATVAIVADLALVLLFVVIGRATHDGDPISGILVTLWPFAVGLIVGWLIGRAWRHPVSPLRTGMPIWLATVMVGMLLRAVSGQGVQPAFVVVAAVVLGLFLVGWRFLARFVLGHSLAQRPSS